MTFPAAHYTILYIFFIIYGNGGLFYGYYNAGYRTGTGTGYPPHLGVPSRQCGIAGFRRWQGVYPPDRHVQRLSVCNDYDGRNRCRTTESGVPGNRRCHPRHERKRRPHCPGQGYPQPASCVGSLWLSASNTAAAATAPTTGHRKYGGSWLTFPATPGSMRPMVSVRPITGSSSAAVPASAPIQTGSKPAEKS